MRIFRNEITIAIINGAKNPVILKLFRPSIRLVRYKIMTFDIGYINPQERIVIGNVM